MSGNIYETMTVIRKGDTRTRVHKTFHGLLKNIDLEKEKSEEEARLKSDVGVVVFLSIEFKPNS